MQQQQQQQAGQGGGLNGLALLSGQAAHPHLLHSDVTSGMLAAVSQ
jgi:hypothetical protein